MKATRKAKGQRTNPHLGKVDKTFFDEIIYPHLGAARPEVLLGPQIGRDNAIVKLGHDQVMAVTTDPLSMIPALGPRDSAWMSVHLLCSDLATSGLPPAYAVLDFNLPPHMEAREFQAYWKAMNEEFSKWEIAIIAGHTGRYIGCDYTIIGGGTLIAIGPEDRYLSSNMAQVGDRVIVTKSAMVATTGILARVFAKTIRARFGQDFLDRAQKLFYHYPVIEDARAAVSIGIRDRGVTAMHDATEGGVLGALYELATAAHCGMRVDLERIPVADETWKICTLFELDPYRSLSEGTLVMSVRPHKAEAVVEALSAQGIPSAIVGEMRPVEEGLELIDQQQSRPLKQPGEDLYWSSFARALERGWK